MHQSMTAAPALPFRGKDCFCGFLGSWRRAFGSPLAPRVRPATPVRAPRVPYALATCFVLGLCSPVVAQSSTAETLEAQAYIWMQRGRADKAAEIWRKLLLSRPQHATALSELAVHAVTVGALAEAQRRLRELQEADPRDGRLPFVRAMLSGGNQVAAELRKARLLSKAGRPRRGLATLLESVW